MRKFDETTFDRDAFKKELEEILERLTPQQLRLVLSRIALRALPLLVLQRDDFSYWREEDRHRHLFNALRANSATFVGVYATYAAAPYYSDAGAAVAAYAAYAAYATYAAAGVAGVADEADTAHGAEVVGLATSVLYQNESPDAGLFVQSIQEDINSIAQLQRETPLWCQTPPETWLALENKFIKTLRRIGFDYWAEQYDGWRRGEFDDERMHHLLNIPEEQCSSAEAMLAWVNSYRNTTRLAEARVIVIGDGAVGKTSLLKRLRGEPYVKDEAMTEGVALSEKLETINGQDLNIHYWDFGGQLFLHPTHQFFCVADVCILSCWKRVPVMIIIILWNIGWNISSFLVAARRR